MKIFFYKVLLVFVFLFILIQFTIGSFVNELREEVFNLKSKKNIEYIKEKIRNEIRVGINNKDYLSDKDAELIRNFIEKIQKELTDKN
jgi:Na+-transporting methylmalonyl-CoA/oxaloacetate decarboxylase gamma subunit